MMYLTTSWDDGYKTDFRLADLLHRYGLKATFYIPKANCERAVIPVAQIKQLAQGFEIGGHSLNHVRLHLANKNKAEEEIAGCYNWLSDVLGAAPVSFCFPGGKYSATAINCAVQTGYRLLRTTEGHSIDGLSKNSMLPTTVHVYPHNKTTHIKHLVKRQQWQHLLRWIKGHSETELSRLVTFYLAEIEKKRVGVFHLWGHSWEIEQYGLWTKLETLFKILSNRPHFTYIENHNLILNS